MAMRFDAIERNLVPGPIVELGGAGAEKAVPNEHGVYRMTSAGCLRPFGVRGRLADKEAL